MNEYKTAKPLILMTKPVGAQCNMKCSYCYYLEKESLQHSAPRIMDDVTLEIFIKNYIKAQNGGFAHFIWHGGESFMIFIKKSLIYNTNMLMGLRLSTVFRQTGL